MQLQEILFSQGFGTRRVCLGLIQQGRVKVGAAICLDPHADFAATGLRFEVQDVCWEYHALAYLALNKPAGYECSQKPGAWPSVYSLLPAPLRQRPNATSTAGVQAVGRLDQDSTGLLLFSDDGKFIHRMSSPRHHVPKVYELTTSQTLDDKQLQRLLAGVVLDDSPKPVRAAACEQLGEKQLRLTLTEGKYHQVKRMLSAVGNRVLTLHRSRIGSLQLRPDLAPGQWYWLGDEQLETLRGRPQLA